MIDEADREGKGEVAQDDFLRIMKKTGLYWNQLPPRKPVLNSTITGFKILNVDIKLTLFEFDLEGSVICIFKNIKIHFLLFSFKI